MRLSNVADSVENKLKRLGLHKTNHDLGIPYKYYSTDAAAIKDIITKHRAIDEVGVLHWSKAISEEQTTHIGAH